MKKKCPNCGVKFEKAEKRTVCCSNQCAANLRSGEKSVAWKGDGVGIDALHAYIRKHLPKPEKCQCCQKVKPYDLANISNQYKRDISDWEWLCRKCHMTKDGRLAEWLRRSSSRVAQTFPKSCKFCGKEFIAKRPETMFCCQSCGTKNQHKCRNFIYYKK